MPTLTVETSNEQLHLQLIQRSKDRRREEYIALLHKRQYPLPVELLKIVIWYLPGYCLDWLPSGECIFRCDAPLTLPRSCFFSPYVQPYVPYVPCIEYDEYSDEEYAEYEEKYNPQY
jgi:hypothetical protein